MVLVLHASVVLPFILIRFFLLRLLCRETRLSRNENNAHDARATVRPLISPLLFERCNRDSNSLRQPPIASGYDCAKFLLSKRNAHENLNCHNYIERKKRLSKKTLVNNLQSYVYFLRKNITINSCNLYKLNIIGRETGKECSGILDKTVFLVNTVIFVNEYLPGNRSCIILI